MSITILDLAGGYAEVYRHLKEFSHKLLSCDGWLGSVARNQQGQSRHIVSFALILCGAILGLGGVWFIQLSDYQVARTRQQEVDTWARRYDSTPAQGVPTVPQRKPVAAPRTVITPEENGYLLLVPKIGLRVIVRELEPSVFSGKNTPALRRYGLGQVPYTSYLRNGSPGAEGTAVIAGHRTTSGAPLKHIDRLAPGDIIIIRKMGVEQQWVVEDSKIVLPSAIDSIRSRPGTRKLALVACNPPFSDKERLVVNARLKQETVEVGASAYASEARENQSSR